MDKPTCSVEGCDKPIKARRKCRGHYRLDAPPCSFDGCTNPRDSKGLCTGHVRQLVRGETLHELVRMARHATPLRDRIRERTLTSDGCWAWEGARSDTGYAHIRWGGRVLYVHRVVWEAENGSVPDGMVIDHRCRNRNCVRVEHLQAVTQKANSENVSLSKANTSGVRGVSWSRSRKKWIARVMHNRAYYEAGAFDSIDDAERAVVAKRLELFTNNLADINA